MQTEGIGSVFEGERFNLYHRTDVDAFPATFPLQNCRPLSHRYLPQLWLVLIPFGFFQRLQLCEPAHTSPGVQVVQHHADHYEDKQQG